MITILSFSSEAKIPRLYSECVLYFNRKKKVRGLKYRITVRPKPEQQRPKFAEPNYGLENHACKPGISGSTKKGE